MAWKLTAAPYCLLFLALTLHTAAALPRRIMVELDEESTLAKLRFEAGDPACGRFQLRFQLRYKCFDDEVPRSSHTPSTEETSVAFAEDAHPQGPSDCGPLGRHKYRCVPPAETLVKTPAPAEDADAAIVHDDARVLPEDAFPQDPSDCGPLGRHKYRCVPPTETLVKTPAPAEDAAILHDAARVLPERPSDCGPLGRHKYRCVPPRKTPIRAPAPKAISPVVDSSVEPVPSPCAPRSHHNRWGVWGVPPMH